MPTTSRTRPDEAVEHLRGLQVAHRLGERGEAGEVREDDGGDQLAGEGAQGVEPGQLGELHHEVLAERVRRGALSDVEDRRLGDRRGERARPAGRLVQLRRREARSAQPLEDVEAEEARLGLGDAAEGVGHDARELDDRLLRETRVEDGAEPPEELEVLLGHQVTAVGEPRGLADLAHEVRRQAGERRGLGPRPDRPGRRRVDQLEVALHAVAPRPRHDLLERDAALEEEPHQAHALDVVRAETVGAGRADQAEALPLAEPLDRLAGPP